MCELSYTSRYRRDGGGVVESGTTLVADYRCKPEWLGRGARVLKLEEEFCVKWISFAPLCALQIRTWGGSRPERLDEVIPSAGRGKRQEIPKETRKRGGRRRTTIERYPGRGSEKVAERHETIPIEIPSRLKPRGDTQV